MFSLVNLRKIIFDNFTPHAGQSLNFELLDKKQYPL